MLDRPFRAVDDLIRRVQRVAADRPDALHILAQTFTIIGESDVDPYAVLGVLIEGAAHSLKKHFPAERQTEAAEMLVQSLDERLQTHGLRSDDR